MRIVRSEAYLFSLQKIMEFIAEDSLARAFDFQSELDDKINDLPYMPYKYKKSIYFHDKNIRDFIFKGYVIPYKIDTPHNNPHNHRYYQIQKGTLTCQTPPTQDFGSASSLRF